MVVVEAVDMVVMEEMAMVAVEVEVDMVVMEEMEVVLVVEVEVDTEEVQMVEIMVVEVEDILLEEEVVQVLERVVEVEDMDLEVMVEMDPAEAEDPMVMVRLALHVLLMEAEDLVVLNLNIVEVQMVFA